MTCLAEKLELRKHSAIVQSSNTSAQQRKAFNGLIYIARDVLSRYPGKSEFSVDVKELKRLIGIDSTNNTQLINALKGLMTTLLEFNILGKNRKLTWKACTLLSDVEIGRGVAKFVFSKTIHERILKPEIYSVIDLNVLKTLESKYSIALYELAWDYIGVEIPQMTIDEFKQLMGARNKYKNSKDVRINIIEPAISEINKKTDLIIEYKFIKQGKKVVGIKFHTEKDSSVLAVLPSKITIKDISVFKSDLDRLLGLLPEKVKGLKTTPHLIKKYLKQEGADYTESNVLYFVKNSKKQSQKYLKDALIGDWAESDRIEKRERAKQIEIEKKKRTAQENEVQAQTTTLMIDIDRAERYFDMLSSDEQQRILNEFISDFSYKALPGRGYKIKCYFEKNDISYV